MAVNLEAGVMIPAEQSARLVFIFSSLISLSLNLYRAIFTVFSLVFASAALPLCYDCD